MPDRVLLALDAFTEALERFREAYEAWLRVPHGDALERERLQAALADAESKLDAARAELDAAMERAP